MRSPMVSLKSRLLIAYQVTNQFLPWNMPVIGIQRTPRTELKYDGNIK